jgi:hypothetical protein
MFIWLILTEVNTHSERPSNCEEKLKKNVRMISDYLKDIFIDTLLSLADIVILNCIYCLPEILLLFFFVGKPNIISIWAENKAGLVNKITSGSVIIDTTPPRQGVVKCPQFIGVSRTVFDATLSTIFPLYRGGLFYCWRNPEYTEKITFPL